MLLLALLAVTQQAEMNVKKMANGNTDAK